MVKLLFTFLLSVATVCTQAQNVGIGTTTPHGSSILDISSNAKGMLIPRMLAVEKDAIVSPAVGLLIYQVNAEDGYYYFDGYNWLQIGKGGNSWSKAGTLLFNLTNNIGIGTSTPNTKLHIAGGTEATLTSGTGYLLIGDNAATNLLFDDNELQARNNAVAAPLSIQPHGGNVGIGTITTPPASRLQIVGTSDVGSNQHGYLLLGETSGINLAFDNDEIQARSNATTASSLYVQSMGGNSIFGAGNVIVNGRIGIGQASPNVKLHIDGGTDAGLASGGYLQIGSTAAANLIFDNNEIIARDNNGTGTLFLQNSGGKTLVGEDFEVNGNITGAVKLEQNSVTVNTIGNFTLTVANKSFIKINCTVLPQIGVGARPILTNGEAVGQILVLLISGIGQVDFLDNPATYNLNLHQSRILNAESTLTLIWTGNSWNEVAVADN